MKVYVVIGSLDYEGYDKPLKVFASEELAKEYCNEAYANCDPNHYRTKPLGYDDLTFFEHEVLTSLD